MNTRLLGTVVAGTLAIGGALAIGGLDDEPAPPEDRTYQVHTRSVTDLTDDRNLVGLAHDVFVATVVRERGHTTGEPLPETQFDVRVVRAVKGSLTGDVIVSQQGGTDARGDTVVVNDDAALEVGRTYLFASLTNEKTGWHTLIPSYGTLSADSSGTKAALLDRFEDAELTQVPYVAPQG